MKTTGPRGLEFRSRLEARWAAFFNAVGWPWEYEPELELRGWIPDFLITQGRGLLVEVKPAWSLGSLEPHKARVEKSGVVAPVLLVGAALTFNDVSGNAYIGLYGWNGGWSDRHLQWRPATLDEVRDWTAAPRPRGLAEAQRAWVRVSNQLQWRPR